jgi:hypothetical protein
MSLISIEQTSFYDWYSSIITYPTQANKQRAVALILMPLSLLYRVFDPVIVLSIYTDFHIALWFFLVQKTKALHMARVDIMNVKIALPHLNKLIMPFARYREIIY